MQEQIPSKPLNINGLVFFAGFQTFHALAHSFLSLSNKTELRGHPAEYLGITVNRKFHAFAALANAAIAIVLILKANESRLRIKDYTHESTRIQ